MNRKLHNSLMAVVSSSALLIVGLLAAAPAQQPLVPPAMVVLTNVKPAQADGTPLVDVTDGSTQVPRRQARFRGQSVQMPFFSFVPRG